MGWRTLFNTARCNLIDANLPRNLWNYAVAHAAYVRNRSYQQRTDCTPYECFTGKQPKIDHMFAFGTHCHVLIENPTSKLDPRSRPGIFVGYSRTSPSYQIYLPDSKKVCESRNVKFHTLPSDLQEDVSCPAPEKAEMGDQMTPDDHTDADQMTTDDQTPTDARPRRKVRPPPFLNKDGGCLVIFHAPGGLFSTFYHDMCAMSNHVSRGP
jgi:hypothetical protein